MSKSFFVIEPDPVVCMDVEGLLSSEYPDALVWAATSLEGSESKRCVFGPDTTVFVKGSLVAEDDRLAKTVRFAATRGSRIVVLGTSRGLDMPVTTIELPFTTDMVIAAVELDRGR